MTLEPEQLFLGFDLSTQQLKVIVCNAKLEHRGTYAVEFDAYYKEKYNIKKGVIAEESTGKIVSPVAMWLDALDMAFGLMKKDSFPFFRVKGISGSCQQHGSVFWSDKAATCLSKLDSNLGLSEQMKEAFAYEYSPNWQDHSTGQEISDFESVAGSADILAKITGSRAHFRFTGLQIRKLAIAKDSTTYKQTKRISLVSSFLASILLGEITDIEEADACGMNIYDIIRSDYDDELLAVAAGVHPVIDGASKEQMNKGIGELKKKLGAISPIGYKNSGCIGPYFVEKYGFDSSTKIYSFTGDNLATILSLPLAANDILVSLGTSTTVLLVTETYKPSSQYHLFKHPTLKDNFMGMICYCNGSLAREGVRDRINDLRHNKDHNDWSAFNSILDSSKTFHNKLGIYFPLGEIVPNASAQFLRCNLTENAELDVVESWSPEEDASLIVESQALSCRLRSGPMLCNARRDTDSNINLGQDDNLYSAMHSKFGTISSDGKIQDRESLTSRPRKAFFVGGASKNLSIIKKMASILGATEGNYRVELPNACALGGAYKASWSYKCENEGEIAYDDFVSKNFNLNDLEKLEVEDKWGEYFDGIGMLAKMEKLLKHN